VGRVSSRDLGQRGGGPRGRGLHHGGLLHPEVEAREGERKELPPELQAQMEEMAALSVGEPEFFDLKRPWPYSPCSPDSSWARDAPGTCTRTSVAWE
jgi:hypothetical protein